MTEKLPESITADELAHYQNCDAFVLMDIRPATDIAQFHLPNTISLPIENLASEINYLDDEKSYIIICALGKRAIGVAQQLRHLDFSVAALDKGIAPFLPKQ